MRAFLIAAVAVALTGGVAAAQSVGGSYNVRGTNPNGSSYGGTAQITPSGSACRITWHTGSTSSNGICMLANKAFAAYYRLGKDTGLAVYELLPDGTLKGYWTIADTEGVGTETLIPQ